MTPRDIAALRQASLHITQHQFQRPGELVTHLGAMQAQDYPGAKWAVGLRLPKATETDIEQSIAAGEIIRTWPMRHTLHFVAPADVRWILDLLAPRVIQAAAGRRRNLELDDKTLDRSRELIIKALEGGKSLTRAELCQILEAGGITTTGQRGIHIFSHWCLHKLLCFGPHSGKQPSFVLLDEWVKKPYKFLERDQALPRLAERYFTSHGPAQVQDFVWWSGLTSTDARKAIELTGSKLTKITVEDKIYWFNSDIKIASQTPAAHLLPGFDELISGYKDRTAVLPVEHNRTICPGGNGMFANTIVINNQVKGTWRRTTKKSAIEITLNPFKAFTKSEKELIASAADRYQRYVDLSVTLTGSS